MDIEQVKETAKSILDNVSRVIVGKEEKIKLVITAMLAGGHILIEDKPGTGKTMLAKAFAKTISGEYKRVQFTPDLMPSDVTGLNIFDRQKSEFKLVKGPIFTNILLADEINRATPRTQSSLLEAMEESQVTIDGVTMKLSEPFIVFATENPVETTGTYPLPEAQLDRFTMKLDMGETRREDELLIIDRFMEKNPYKELEPVCKLEDIISMQEAVTKVYIKKCIKEYIVDIIMATRQDNKLSDGVSTRGTLSLVRCARGYAAIQGRGYVIPDDVKAVAPYVLGHRLTAFGTGYGHKNISEYINDIVEGIEVPLEDWEK